MAQLPNPTGLSTREARQRQIRYGPNDIESKQRHGLLCTLRSVATEPMFLLLLVCAVLYLAIGDPGEGLLLAFLALVMVGLVVFLERRSERALDALRALAAPRVRVIRGRRGSADRCAGVGAG